MAESRFGLVGTGSDIPDRNSAAPAGSNYDGRPALNRRTREDLMQEDDTKDEKTASHDQINGPGMTNGVPDGMDEAKSKGRPTSGREESEAGPHSGGSGT